MVASTSSDWETEEVSPRSKVMSFIFQMLEQGATDEQLLDDMLPKYIVDNGFLEMSRLDLSNMIRWARIKHVK